jgi:hypothetical protein
MKVTSFIKFRRLQWARHVIRMENHDMPKKTLQQQINSKKPQEKLGRWSERECHRVTWHMILEN